MLLPHISSGPWDQPMVEQREDVLVSRALGLSGDVEVTGRLSIGCRGQRERRRYRDRDSESTPFDLEAFGNALMNAAGRRGSLSLSM